MKKSLFGYAVVLGALAWALQTIQFRHQVLTLPTEMYVVVVALVFVGLGLWAGRKLGGSALGSEFQRNERAQATLGISEREMEVLESLAAGLSNREIAERLFVSQNTVKTHLKHLYDKLGVSRRTQAVGKARELRLVP